MSEPITWRNVQGANLAASAAPLAYAGQSFDRAFDRLGGALTGYEQGQQKDLEFARLQQKNAFLDVLAQAKSPEELAALEQSGALQAAQAGMDPMALASVRGAAESRNAALMGLTKERNSFDDALQTRQLKLLSDTYNGLIQNGDIAGAEAFKQANANVPGIVNVISQGEDFLRNRVKNQNADALVPGAQQLALGAQQASLVQQPLDQAGKLADTQWKEATRGKRQEAELGTLDLAQKAREDSARVFAEKEEDRALTQTLYKARDEHLKNENASKVFSNTYAKLRGMPMNEDGTVNYAKLSPEQVKQIDKAAKDKGYNAVGSGDTDAFRNFNQKLVESGQFSRDAIERNIDKLRATFDSTTGKAEVGNDAQNTLAARTKADLELENTMGNNPSAPGNPTVRKVYNEIAEDLAVKPGKYIDMESGNGILEDVSFVQNLVYEIGEKGIEIEPGKFVVPPVNMVKNAMRTAPGDWWVDEQRSQNIRNALKKELKGSNALKMLAEAEEAEKAYQTKQFRDRMKGSTAQEVKKGK